MAARPQSISLATATSITIANMIGTGVFTSLGFQVVDVTSGFALLMLWVVGGVFALCGALSYGELAAALPRSGGELNFLSRTLHPAVGFLSGWVSFTAGFAAPIALAAMAFGRYLQQVEPRFEPLVTSTALVVVVALVHLRDLRIGSLFQNGFTAFKVLLAVFFLSAPLWIDTPPTGIRFLPRSDDWGTFVSGPWAVSLLFVMFSYAGWNASAYIVGEIRDPERNVPRSLLLGTAIVMVIYVGLNWAFLVTTPISEIAGKIEVGHVVATQLFGSAGGRWMSALLCVALVSSISAMTWAGPRVTQMIGEDYGFFRLLARTNAAGIPQLAILVQSALVVVMLWTSTFDKVLVYVQLTLVASSALTVLGLFRLRLKRPDLPRPYRAWGYPWTPALFLLISVITMAYTLYQRPWESLAGVATVLLGLPVYYLSPRSASPSPVE